MNRLRIFLLSTLVLTSVFAINSKGASAAEWKQDSIGWWYAESNSYATNWRLINNVWYHFDSNGYMQQGWICDNGIWYYLNNDGAMKTGWIQDNNNWYYLNNDGSMKTGWLDCNGKSYYLNSNGVMQVESITIDGKVYDFAKTGELISTSDEKTITIPVKDLEPTDPDIDISVSPIPVPSTPKTKNHKDTSNKDTSNNDTFDKGKTTIPVNDSKPLESNSSDISISLEGNPSTGYGWTYGMDIDGIIKEESMTIEQDNIGLDICGAPQNYTWKFVGLKEGTTYITFNYSRSWENTLPIKAITYKVVVDKNLNVKADEILQQPISRTALLD